jgi:hypothetical protein
MVIGVDLMPIISYSKNGVLRVIHCTAVNCAAKENPLILDSNSFAKDSTAITIGTDNFPIIVYSDGTTSTLRVIHCTAINCSTTDAAVGFDSGYLRDPSIAIGVDGYPIMSYGTAAGSLGIIHCTNLSCSTTDAITTMTSVTSVNNTSMAIGADGLPVIAMTANGIKVLHCTTIICSSTDPVLTIDSATTAGTISLTISTDHLPILSYATNSQLSFARCTNTTCTAATKLIVDSTFAAITTTISVGEDGFPVIGYHGGTNSDMKFAKAGNQWFVNNLKRR